LTNLDGGGREGRQEKGDKSSLPKAVEKSEKASLPKIVADFEF
jgi:hypothetical protein